MEAAKGWRRRGHPLDGEPPSTRQTPLSPFSLVNSGNCWVSGTVTTSQALGYDAVLIVDTGAGGELCGAYVWNGAWAHLDDLALLADVERHEVYPFDYSLNVPLDVDYFD